MSIDETLSIDQLYDGKPLEEFYRCSQFAEKEQADVMLHDLQLKQDLIIDL